MTTGKTIALTRQTFVGKVMSLLLNMLSRLVIMFLPSSKRLLIPWLQSPSAVILEPPKIKSDTVSTVSLPISHEVMGPDAMIFRYDLNQIPYNYMVEVTNRFKGLDLIDRVPEELWTKVHDIVQETTNKTIPEKKKCKKAKWLSEEAFQIAEKREVKGKGEKERYTCLNAEFQRLARRDKKAFLGDQCKEIEENNRMGKTEISSKNLEIPREYSC